jgi:serine phosphatase RsbU (regulator of sigma subunit)
MSAKHRLARASLVVAAALVGAAAVVRLAAPRSELTLFLLFLAVLVGVYPAALAVRWLWRRLTYRVGVRLFVSYLLIGLTPFALFAFVAVIAGYVLSGQYAATLVRAEIARLRGAMGERAADAVHALASGEVEHARALLSRGSPGADAAMHEEWLLAEGTREWRSPGAATLPVPRWVGEGAWSGAVVLAGSAYLASVERGGGRTAAVLLPLDLANARAFTSAGWYEVRFVSDVKTALVGEARASTVTLGTSGRRGEPPTLRIDGRPVPASEVEAGWLTAKPPSGTLWQRARVVWMWTAETPRDLATGKAATHALVLALIKLSPRGAIADLFGPSERLRGEVKGMAVALGGAFATVYLIALSFAVVMILRVTRAAARLTRGARAVSRGDLDHRIPVRVHDQLGDLAASFNAMASSVQGMLVQVAEKERMAREVELARELQSSLLPPAELSAGPLAVWAHFRPAAEVGGDYFDLFPLAPGELLVAIGDVAGHGLPTGLLMAMVKSAVATLVEEGYRGVELLARLNHLLLAQSLKQRMVSFALAEADGERGEVKITSAGHQPGVLLAADGRTEEVLLSSLPLGHRWPELPTSRTLPFAPGARLLLYSDGLVEARDASGAPFGHDKLRATLEAQHAADGPSLIRSLLAALDAHLGGEPLADDLTVVLLEHHAASD